MNANLAIQLGLAACLAAAGAVVQAQGPGPGMGPGAGPGFGEHRPPMEDALGPHGAHGRWWNDPALVEKLKLTDDQRKAMDAILLDHREKLIDMRAAVEKAEIQLEPLMRDDQPNESKILSQIDKVAQARAELEKANARFLLALRSKLSPEQWKQLQAERSSRMERRGSGRGGMRNREDDRRQGPPPSPGSPQGVLNEGPVTPPNPAENLGDR